MNWPIICFKCVWLWVHTDLIQAETHLGIFHYFRIGLRGSLIVNYQARVPWINACQAYLNRGLWSSLRLQLWATENKEDCTKNQRHTKKQTENVSVCLIVWTTDRLYYRGSVYKTMNFPSVFWVNLALNIPEAGRQITGGECHWMYKQSVSLGHSGRPGRCALKCSPHAHDLCWHNTGMEDKTAWPLGRSNPISTTREANISAECSTMHNTLLQGRGRHHCLDDAIDTSFLGCRGDRQSWSKC